MIRGKHTASIFTWTPLTKIANYPQKLSIYTRLNGATSSGTVNLGVVFISEYLLASNLHCYKPAPVRTRVNSSHVISTPLVQWNYVSDTSSWHICQNCSTSIRKGDDGKSVATAPRVIKCFIAQQNTKSCGISFPTGCSRLQISGRYRLIEQFFVVFFAVYNDVPENRPKVDHNHISLVY